MSVDTTRHHKTPGAVRILTMSSISFTLMFAVWLMSGILGKPIQKEFGLDPVQLSWISAVVVLNGSMWCLPVGILADRFGGRTVFTAMVTFGAVASLAISFVDNYTMLLALAFCVGTVGDSFPAGVAWNSAWYSPQHKGSVLGVFGAGNVGASITRIVGPGTITATAGSAVLGFLPGGWRLIPIVYATLLTVVGILQRFVTPFPDRTPGASAKIFGMLAPPKDIRVWRLSLYYAVALGAYVAYPAILPTYYQDVFRVDFGTAVLLTTTFIFPASLPRPLGGWVPDCWGTQTATCATFVSIGALFTILCIPSGVDEQGNAYGLPLWLVVTLAFSIGCIMGIDKAGVCKHIPTYPPYHVGSVGGLVSMLGGLGGLFLPPIFAHVEKFTGLASTPSIALAVLTGLMLTWMHLMISRMERMNPETDLVEVPDGARPVQEGEGRPMNTPAEKPHSGEWLENWNPQGESKWDSRIAWATLTIMTSSLTMAFVSWFLPSAIISKFTFIGFALSKGELYQMTSVMGLSAGILRLVWMVPPPVLDTRKLVAITSVLMILPLIGWRFAVQNSGTPYWLFMALALLVGIGGGVLFGFMPPTSYFFSKRLQGTASGLQAGIGNFGVSLMQLLTSWLIGFFMVSWLGAVRYGLKGDAWYQNAAFAWVPLLVATAVWAWLALKSAPIKVNIRWQFSIFSNPDTQWMIYLYIMTSGTFSGLSTPFGLLMTNLYGLGAGLNNLVAQGYVFRDPAVYAFLGPLVRVGARVTFSPLTDKMDGAIWTLISGTGLVVPIPAIILGLTSDKSSVTALDGSFNLYLQGMLAIFLLSGIGNASTFRQMSMIFEPRQAGGVIGWTAAIAAFGPFLSGVGVTLLRAVVFYWIGVVFVLGGAVITWQRYAREGAPKPS